MFLSAVSICGCVCLFVCLSNVATLEPFEISSRNFYGSKKWSEQFEKAEGQWLSTMSKDNLIRRSSSKDKNVTKKFNTYSTMLQKNLIHTAPWRPKIQRCSEDRKLKQARSKPDPVDQLVMFLRALVSAHLGKGSLYSCWCCWWRPLLLIDATQLRDKECNITLVI